MKADKSELPVALEIALMVAVGIGICFWKGKENIPLFIGFLIPIVILAVPIERKLKKEWPDWAELWFLNPLDKFRFMIASGFSALIVLPSYFYIIKPLTT